MTCYIPESQPCKEVYSVPVKSSYFLICILTAQNVVKIWENALSTESKCEWAASGCAQGVCPSGWQSVSVRMSSTLLTHSASLPPWGGPRDGSAVLGPQCTLPSRRCPGVKRCFWGLCKPAAATTALKEADLPFPALPVAITKSRFFSVLQVTG